MLPFHDGPVIRENIIAKILFASCSAKISYRENFRVYGITTDNAADITNAVVNELKLPHFGCVGHVLQLSIGKAFKLGPVDRVLGKVKRSVAHFQRSNNETYAF